MIIVCLTSGPLDTNGYLIGCPDTKKAAAIDVPPEAAPLFLAKAQELGLAIEKILLTHSHWDHIADVALLKEMTHAQVLIHGEDAKNLIQPGSDRLPLYFPIVGVQPDTLLNEGDQISVGKLSLEVIHTPGHSPGSICFYVPTENLLFSGDTLFQGGIGNLSLPTSQPKRMEGSLQKLATLKSQTQVYPGHGDMTLIQYEFPNGGIQ